MYNHPQKIWSKILSWKMLKVLRRHWWGRYPAKVHSTEWQDIQQHFLWSKELALSQDASLGQWTLKGAPTAPSADLMILMILMWAIVQDAQTSEDIRRYQKISEDHMGSRISQSEREQKKRQHTCWRATIADKIDETANWAKHNSMGRGAWFVHLEARVKLSCENAQISDNFGPPLRVDDHYELRRDQEKNPFAANLHQKRMAEMF